MPIRTVKQHSDRGKISELARSEDIVVSTLNPTRFENRLLKLYEYAKQNNDENLLAASGFITTDYISDKNSLPLSIYRLRQTVDDIKSKSSSQIDSLSESFSGALAPTVSTELVLAVEQAKIVKKASARRPPSFWRVSKT